MPAPTKINLKQMEIVESLILVKAEMKTIVAESLIIQTLKSRLHPAKRYVILPGDSESLFGYVSSIW